MTREELRHMLGRIPFHGAEIMKEFDRLTAELAEMREEFDLRGKMIAALKEYIETEFPDKIDWGAWTTMSAITIMKNLRNERDAAQVECGKALNEAERARELRSERDEANKRIATFEEYTQSLIAQSNRLQAELAAMRSERDALSNDLHDAEITRLQLRRKVEELLVMTGNAYRPEPPAQEVR